MTPDVSDLTALTACDLLDAYASRALSPVEVVEATLARIDHLDGPIKRLRHADAGAGARGCAPGGGRVCRR